jgi:ribosomal protein S18 acetylase RimI-like enzyme
VRRLYVFPRCRRRGLARSIVTEIICRGAECFDTLTVNAGKLDARGFYEHLGFTPVAHAGITHVKKLAHNPALHVIGAKRASS